MNKTVLLVLAAVLGACATPAIVVLSPDYASHKPRRVALLSFTDRPGAAGSGETAAAAFEKYLLWGGYSVVERRQVAQLLKEQAFSVSGAVDPATARKLGKILGVDALALGSVTDFSNAGERTVLVDLPQQKSEPIYGKVTTSQQSGDTTVKTESRVVTGYTYKQIDRVVPETRSFPARVGLSVRLVDVQTGQVLWSGSDSSDGVDLGSAAEQASSAIMRAVVKQLQQSSR